MDLDIGAPPAQDHLLFDISREVRFSSAVPHGAPAHPPSPQPAGPVSPPLWERGAVPASRNTAWSIAQRSPSVPGLDLDLFASTLQIETDEGHARGQWAGDVPRQ